MKKLDRLDNQLFIDAFQYVGIVGAIASERMEKPVVLQSDEDREKYVMLIDPIDGSSNLEVDCVVGSIFPVYRLTGDGSGSILQVGTRRVTAGHVMYGTAVAIVYSAGDGVHSFVLDQEIGEFVLVHERIRMPEQGKIFSANLGNRGRWSPPAGQFADALLKDRDRPCFLRYSGALVTDLLQILHYGGIYFYPEAINRYEEL